MASFVLWIEGVDFARTIDDTADLSTRRGASLTLLKAPERLGELLARSLGAESVKPIFTGASQGAFELVGDETAIREAVDIARALPPDSKHDAPYAHMRFVLGLARVEGENPDRAFHAARAMARFNQYRQAETTIRPTGQGQGFCPIDRMRAADSLIKVPTDAFPSGALDAMALGVEEDDKSREIAVSASVADRRNFGRKARQAFYERELRGQGEARPRPWTFVDSLHEMVALDGEARKAIPQSIRGKIAVFYADGNGFTKIRNGLEQSAVRGSRRFSGELKELQRSALLGHLLGELARMRDDPATADRVAWRGEKLRIETLMWGGDEVMWVVPAWLGWWLARRFFRLTSGWKIGDTPLTFAAGLLFCPMKMPIRDATRLAHDLSDLAKRRSPSGALDIEVLESIDPPEEGFAKLRARLLGMAEDDKRHGIPAEDVDDAFGRLAWLKSAANGKPALPRSQIYRILRTVGRDTALVDAGHAAASEFQAYLDREGTARARDLTLGRLALTKETSGEEFTALNLHRIAELWDYVGPFAGDPS